MKREELNDLMYSRRSVLRGVGAGAFLLAPLVKSLGAFAQTGKVPLRLLIVPHYHGWLNVADVPKGASLTLPAPYQSFNPIKDQLLIVRGLCGNASWGNAHDDCPSGLLTANLKPNSASFSKPSGISFDRLLRNQLTTPKTLDPQYFSVENDNYANNYCWDMVNGNLSSVSFFSDLNTFFSRVAGQAPSSSGTSNLADAIKTRRKYVLDDIKYDISLVRNKLPSDQRLQLDSQLAAIATAEKNLGLVNTGAAPSSGGACKAPNAPMDGPYATRMKSALELYKVMISCNMNQVLGVLNCPAPGMSNFTWQYPEGTNRGNALPPPAPGNTRTDQHDVVAHWSTDEQKACYHSMIKLLADQIGVFAQSLSQTEDLDGRNQLDNTLIVLTGCISDGHHEQLNKAVTLLGGKGAGIRGGRSIDHGLNNGGNIFRNFAGTTYEIQTWGSKAGTKTEADLYVSIARMMGLNNMQIFGDAGLNTVPIALT